MGKVLHASYSGYFPTCIQTELPNIQDLQARYSGEASSLELMMALYWRVREWEINYQSQEEGGGTVTATGVYGFDASTEEGLVCAPQFIEKSFSSNIAFFQEHFFSILSLFPNLFYAVTSSNNEAFNYAFQTLYYGADDRSEGGSIYSGHVASELGEEAIEETLSIQIADIGIAPFKITKFPDLANNYAQFTIAAKNYWSYGGLYNETTGQLL